MHGICRLSQPWSAENDSFFDSFRSHLFVCLLKQRFDSKSSEKIVESCFVSCLLQLKAHIKGHSMLF